MEQPLEAINAIRGFVAQFIETTTGILRLGDGERLYVEAFEDIQAVDAEGLTKNTQVKDEIGEFSITRKPVCEMLERWVKAYREHPSPTSFAIVTTQSLGNLHDKSSSFADWIGGQRDDATFASIRDSLFAFVDERYKQHCPELHQLFTDEAKARQFWDVISWCLNEPALQARFDELVAIVAERMGCNPDDAMSHTFGFVGAVAYHAASENVEDRCWTKELFGDN